MMYKPTDCYFMALPSFSCAALLPMCGPIACAALLPMCGPIACAAYCLCGPIACAALYCLGGMNTATAPAPVNQLLFLY